MKTVSQTVSYPGLKGSEQHLPLKNQPGEKADEDHAESDKKMSEETEKAVDDSGSETQIADAFRELKKDD